MPDSTATDTSTTDGNQTSGTTSTAGDEFTPITSQDDLNRVLDDRLKRERAKYADYKDVKAKAARLDEIEQANLSELEKVNARAAAIERERDQAKADALKLRIAAKHGISEEDADLFLTGMDEETLTAQAKRLADRDADRKKHGNYSPREGTTSTSPDSEALQTTRELFGGR